MAFLNQAIHDGARCFMRLRPDVDNPQLRVRVKAYTESYAFPFLTAMEGVTVGGTRPSHLVHQPGTQTMSINGFLYFDQFPVYVNYIFLGLLENLEKGFEVKICGIDGYLEKEFVYGPAGRIVWDLERPEDKDALADAIESGTSLFASFTNQFGIHQRMPVDLTYLFDDGPPSFQTEIAYLPNIALDPTAFTEYLENGRSRDALRNAGFVVDGKVPAYTMFYRLFGDGTGYDMGMIPQDKRFKLEHLRIIAL